ncbi:hypothetical protein [Fluviispira sanaruensis]|uniref:Uncharacterized protein n=1 Tax=Fluviispira sanaruensis TaxID=2493639 RepID=A0A4V0P2G1_FLUSA|nr:hypothetical protein [Fluviispira sanaruensis]BBH53107.1 hypothetical protein JCM31447_15500 [Fluviispira sanaruensis]
MKKIITLSLLLTFSSAYSANNSQNQTIYSMNANEAIQFINKQKKFIITFIGFSGAGYEDKNEMLAYARKELKEHLEHHGLENTIVSIGATAEGIGEVYPLAKEMGFNTLGIVSSEAKKYNVPLSISADIVIYVTDSYWGGFLPEKQNTLSPTSQIVVNTADKVIAIGGGAVGRDEMLSSIQSGKNWSFYFAEMNRLKAINSAHSKNLAPPDDFSGETFRGLYEKGYL